MSCDVPYWLARSGMRFFFYDFTWGGVKGLREVVGLEEMINQCRKCSTDEEVGTEGEQVRLPVRNCGAQGRLCTRGGEKKVGVVVV